MVDQPALGGIEVEIDAAEGGRDGRVSMVILNIAVAVVVTYALYIAPVYLIGHWLWEGLVSLAVGVAGCVVLYFTWYRTLPKDGCAPSEVAQGGRQVANGVPDERAADAGNA